MPCAVSSSLRRANRKLVTTPRYNPFVNRRTFIGSTLGAGLAAAAATAKVPIIDTHIHLFDVNRPQGVPWPDKGSKIYQTAIPSRYRTLAVQHGIVGAIEVEASPWLEDNQWVLDTMAKDTIMVGTVGDLEPGSPEFAKQFDRFHKNPMFLGIRYGNIWDRDLSKELAKPAFVEGLKRLAAAGMVMDTANPTPSLMRAAVDTADKVPGLKIVLDHLPELVMPDDPAARRACDADLRRLAANPNVYGKISGTVVRRDPNKPLELSFFRDHLDYLWGIFGPDRLMYGSDWPNSDQWADYHEVFRLANEFISGKDISTQEKFYWKNSVKAYKWKKRSKNQPQG